MIIIAKKLNTTESSGTRVTARVVGDPTSRRVVLPYDYALNLEKNLDRAARQVILRGGLSAITKGLRLGGLWARGDLDASGTEVAYVRVLAATTAELLWADPMNDLVRDELRVATLDVGGQEKNGEAR